MNKNIGCIGLFVLLAACGGNPTVSKPARLQIAEAAVLAANRATQAGSDADAVAFWREAGLAYSSIDDWAGQGEAKLGLAQSLVRQGKRDEALRILADLRNETLYLAAIRARAAYQQALLQLAEPDQARQSLAQARALCGIDCTWLARLDNLQARLDIQIGAYASAATLLDKVLGLPALPPSERAHALRLLAQIWLQSGDLSAARQKIDEAIAIDRQLAEPAYLVDDYIFLERYAVIAGDAALVAEAGKRLQSLCFAFAATVCQSR